MGLWHHFFLLYPVLFTQASTFRGITSSSLMNLIVLFPDPAYPSDALHGQSSQKTRSKSDPNINYSISHKKSWANYKFSVGPRHNSFARYIVKSDRRQLYGRVRARCAISSVAGSIEFHDRECQRGQLMLSGQALWRDREALCISPSLSTFSLIPYKTAGAQVVLERSSSLPCLW